MTPYMLENLYLRMGSPRWFWPLVFFVLFIALPLVQSALEVNP